MENLKYNERMVIDGRAISLTIFGVTLYGAKAIAAIVGETVVVGGVAAGGFYLVYK